MEKVVRVEHVAPYESGYFYKRELPCLLPALRAVPHPTSIIIDGNVWLDDDKPGLGARLYGVLKQEVPVLGIAKTTYRGSTNAQTVFRGTSQRPLYFTSAGMSLSVAAAHVKALHGPHRMPTLVMRADQLCRACKEL
jgi:deoxyribonuclease V